MAEILDKIMKAKNKAIIFFNIFSLQFEIFLNYILIDFNVNRTGDNKNVTNIPINKNKPKDLTGINPLKDKVPKERAVVIIAKNIDKNVTSFFALLFEKNMQ